MFMGGYVVVCLGIVVVLYGFDMENIVVIYMFDFGVRMWFMVGLMVY